MNIVEEIGEAAALEQLAEEAAELCQIALKKARILRGENPTPVEIGVANENLIEEYTDVIHCAQVLGLSWDAGILCDKHKRWKQRIAESNQEG